MDLRFFFLFLFLLPLVNSATYYVATDGSDGNDGSSNSEWATFTHAFTQMSSGDTLIVRDGTYNEDMGEWSNPLGYFDQPPSGTSSQYTQILAENDGGAIVRGENDGYAELYLGSSFTKVEGFKFLSDGASVAQIGGSNNELRRNAFGNMDEGGSYDSIISVDGVNILLEDNWAWGGGRAAITTGSDNLTVRRFVARII